LPQTNSGNQPDNEGAPPENNKRSMERWQIHPRWRHIPEQFSACILPHDTADKEWKELEKLLLSW
jgi:hypothetical protein